MLTLALALTGCRSPQDEPPELCNAPLEADASPMGTPPLEFRGKVPRNLLFLSIDTLRQDHVGVYGDLDLTPTLDCLGNAGVVLEDFQQCSNWTMASTTCTLAGRTHAERGHLPRLRGKASQRLPVPEGETLLAGILGEAGYTSIVVSNNDFLSPKWGNTQGYTEAIEPGSGAGRVIDKGLNALRRAVDDDEQPWFLHLHFMEPHAGYRAPAGYLDALDDLEPWPTDLSDRDTHYRARREWPDMEPERQALLEEHLRIRYAAEVRWLDDQLGDALDRFDRGGWLDDTLVVVWSDHGEQFWEHGDQTHAYLLHGEETDAVALFWAKTIVPARVSSPTHAIDLVPTVLRTFGLPIPGHVTGLPVGEAPPDRFRFASALARKGLVQSVERDGLRMQYRWFNGKVEVFDTTTDPGETKNLYNPRNPAQLDLWAVLREQAEALAPLVVDGDPAPVWPSSLP